MARIGCKITVLDTQPDDGAKLNLVISEVSRPEGFKVVEKCWLF